MSERLALKRSIGLGPVYADDTRFGALISGQAELRIKAHLRPLVDAVLRGLEPGSPDAEAQIAALLGDDLYRAPGCLRDEVLYPPLDRTRPIGLRIDGLQGARKVSLPPALVADLASWLGDWQRGEGAPATGAARELYEGLRDLGAFEPLTSFPPPRSPVTFIGHATVLLHEAGTRICVDPFLLPTEPGFPAGYQPFTNGDFTVDAVLITHAHRDHFHPDSLLRFGRDTLIVVPEVERESLLSVDMAARLRALGFTNVRTLRWYGEMGVGFFRIQALPFYGEQPTTDEVLHPEVRNVGNNYVVAGGGRRYAFVADAGRDRSGDVRGVAAAAFAQQGAIDVLFGGYRSWSLFPAQYALTSVAPYLLFVPPAAWGVRQQIMNDAQALLDTAERWHARHVVPYADGGAPWYWQLELGPRLDGAAPLDNPHADPRPEAVLRAALERSAGGGRAFASPCRPLLIRPGESLAFDGGVAKIVANEGHRWPYAPAEAVSSSPGSTLEPIGLTKKRVLLRLLARDELGRRGIAVDAAQVQDMSDELRRDNHLADRQAMLSWLAGAGLSMDEYTQILTDWRGVICLESAMEAEIERHVAGQRAFATMRTARGR